MGDSNLRQRRYRRRARLALLIAWVLGGGFALIVLGRVYEAYPEDDYCLWHPRRCEANATYAAWYFDGLVPVKRVLESRETFVPPYLAGDQDGLWDCTYAIVELGEDAPETPPTRSTYMDVWQPKFWPENWEPIRQVAGTVHEQLKSDYVLSECSVYWSRETVERLGRALEERGSWVVSGEERDGSSYIYSKRHRIAARVTFGD